MSERRLMSVRSEVVRETMVAAICDRARGRAGDPIPELIAAVLDEATHPGLARVGYHARATETDLFEPARRPMAWLADELRTRARGGPAWPHPVSELAARLAADEPRERPDPGDPDAVSWRIPGPGGHVRHYVALRLTGSEDPALKRDVMFGFVVRCCEEASPPKTAGAGG